MRTTIDAGGRVVVPKRWRDLLGLVGGSEVEIEFDGTAGAVSIKPAEVELQLIEEDGLWVTRAATNEPGPDVDDVRDILEAIRDRRL